MPFEKKTKIIIIQCTRLHKPVTIHTVHSEYLAVPFPGEPLSNPSPELHSSLHLHSTLSHALRERYNPWLISSVNQWDSLVTTTKVARRWFTQADSILEHHPSHQGWEQDCFQHKSAHIHRHTSDMIHLEKNISCMNND